MIKVIFLGSRPLGFAALKILQGIKDYKIVGAVVKEPPVGAWWAQDPFWLEIPRLTLEDLESVEFDLGVSINFWKIIDPKIIMRPRLGFVNIHHSYNLSLRGRDMATHAILNARDSGRWYHGATLHYIDEGLDTGPIIASQSCTITEWDTAWTLFEKVESLGKNMLETWLPRLALGRPPLCEPEKNQPLNLRRPNEDVRVISDIFSNPLRAYDIVRAYDFAGHYPPASTAINGEMFFLTTESGKGSPLIDLGGRRGIFRLNSF
jgi:methionyl-tRNA formyltransferase